MKALLLWAGFAVTGVAVLSGCGTGVTKEGALGQSINAAPFSVPSKFFGMHVHDRGQAPFLPTYAIPVQTFRTVDSPVVWPIIEPSRGVFNWTKADEIISQASKNGIDVIMNLYRTPNWASSQPTQDSAYSSGCNAQPSGQGCGNAAPPSNLADWDAFIQSFATRYKGKVKYYEVWNEPEDQRYWSGTLEQMVLLASDAYRVIKTIDPNAQVISPSISSTNDLSWLQAYFAAGGASHTDIVGFHGYGYAHNPEQISSGVASLRSLAETYGLKNAEIWDTEASWGRDSDVTPDQQLRCIAALHLFQLSAGVDRNIWYALNNRLWGTLTTNPGVSGPYVLNSSGGAYTSLYHWLSGATLRSCGQAPVGYFYCNITEASGRDAMVAWSAQSTIEISLKSLPEFTEIRDIQTNSSRAITTDTIQVSTPVLLE